MQSELVNLLETMGIDVSCEDKEHRHMTTSLTANSHGCKVV